MAVKPAMGLAPWAGLVAGMVGAGVQHQLVADSMHFDCRLGRVDPFVGAAALLLILMGAAVSWAALRRSRGRQDNAQFVAAMSLMAAALFALLVVWQTMASFVLPACAP
jgi:hypothetical protein